MRNTLIVYECSVQIQHLQVDQFGQARQRHSIALGVREGQVTQVRQICARREKSIITPILALVRTCYVWSHFVVDFGVGVQIQRHQVR